jgi:transposase
MRTSVRIQREILRLVANSSDSNRKIGKRFNITHKVPAEIRKRLSACDLEADKILELDDSKFVKTLGTESKLGNPDSKEIDWTLVQKELETRDMTIALLWEEYRAEASKNSVKAISYSHFSRRYREWLKSQRLSMRQFHVPGRQMFVDFCGKTMPIVNQENNSVTYAQIFVGVLGASGYIFIHAVKSQKIVDWIECNVKALEFFGGVPEEIVPDNLKSAVIRNTKVSFELNRYYEEMSEHYGVVIHPARPGKPQDKSLAEVSVQICQRWVLAYFRHRTFFSIEELNVALKERTAILNEKNTRTYPDGRKNLFDRIERNTLKPLPENSFEISEWKYNVRVPYDYHIAYNNSCYSVPYQHRGNKIDVRITNNTIEAFINMTRIAGHIIRTTPGVTTLPEHLAPNHLEYSESKQDALIEWAEGIGSNTLAWVQRNLERKDFVHGLKSAGKLRRWVREEQNQSRLESACGFALKLDILPFDRLKSIITNKSDLKTPVKIQAKREPHENIRGKNYYGEEGV